MCTHINICACICGTQRLNKPIFPHIVLKYAKFIIMKVVDWPTKGSNSESK